MKHHRVRCHEGKADGPTSSEQPGERHDRERDRQHGKAEIRRHDTATGSVLVLIEEAEARRDGEQGSSDHYAPHPPAVS